MNRQDFKTLAEIRLEEAYVLLHHGNTDGAYYLAGYAVECSLKACISKLTQQYDFADLETVKKSYSHDLSQLAKIAGLETAMNKAFTINRTFEVNWGVVKDWSESSRYGTHTAAEARDLIHAIDDKKSGVMPWLQRRW
jgi:HEPN domain-containing protein